MSTRLERIGKALKAKKKASELIIVPYPMWAENRHEPGYLTDPNTVRPPTVLGSRDLTEAELDAYVQERLEDRRATEEYRRELAKGTQDRPEHLNDQARQIRESMQRGRHDKGGE